MGTKSYLPGYLRPLSTFFCLEGACFINLLLASVGPGEVDIHLMSPITGESHPEAKASPIYENLPRANSYDIELYHHFVSVKSRTQPETEMCVYDWRSGTRKLVSNSISDNTRVDSI